ncbi:MAG: NUDIX hydrolase [Cytophagaceae bacterium]|nr:NUDIX hydrolase [Cytophagaceae bacterium]
MKKTKAKLIFFQQTSEGVKILLGRRIVSEREEFWWLPGGSAEEGEKEFEAAVRELHEELYPIPYLEDTVRRFVQDEELPKTLEYWTDKSRVVLFLIEVGEDVYTNELPLCREEFQEMKWFLLHEVPANISREYTYIKEYMNDSYFKRLYR